MSFWVSSTISLTANLKIHEHKVCQQYYEILPDCSHSLYVNKRNGSNAGSVKYLPDGLLMEAHMVDGGLEYGGGYDFNDEKPDSIIMIKSCISSRMQLSLKSPELHGIRSGRLLSTIPERGLCIKPSLMDMNMKGSTGKTVSVGVKYGMIMMSAWKMSVLFLPKTMGKAKKLQMGLMTSLLEYSLLVLWNTRQYERGQALMQ